MNGIRAAIIVNDAIIITGFLRSERVGRVKIAVMIVKHISATTVILYHVFGLSFMR